jgi:endoglucanase
MSLRKPAIAVAFSLATVAAGLVVSSPAAPARAAASACTVAYSVTSSWQGGFQGGITITNNGPAITSWTLDFAFPLNDQAINSGWGGTYTQNGRSVSTTSASYDGALGTGASTTIGFIAAGPATGTPPGFFVNGFACNGAAQVPDVKITSPAAYANFTPGQDITIAAPTIEPASTIAKVEYFANGTLIGTVTASPFTFTWASVPAGYYNLTAQASDSAGVTATSVPVTVSVVPATSTAPQLHVTGNKLVDASGKQVILRGANRSGTEYSCVQGNGIFDGPSNQASLTAMKQWGINAVRVPLNEACWNAEPYVSATFAGTSYQTAIKQYVQLLGDNGIVAILDLHWTDGAYSGPSSGCGSAQAVCQKPMPDAAQAIPFWTSVASAFKGNDAVIFDLFNEPFASRADNNNSAEGWQCWATGSPCTGISYPVAGMQQMISAVRGTGADNVLMLGGEEFSNDLTSWLANMPADPDHNLVASWHSYNFNACATLSCWTSQVAPVIAQVPVVAGEIGENDCAGTYINPLMAWMDSQSSGYLAWAWDAGFDCSSGPGLIIDYQGDPTGFGAPYQAHLASLGS